MRVGRRLWLLALLSWVALSWVQAGGALQAATLDAGYYHTCALTESGTVQCWGRNSDGQLGDGTTTSRSAPVAVKDLSGVSALAVGFYHTCALLESGIVQCWGRNSNGQLGDSTTMHRTIPVAVRGLSGVSELVSLGFHTCALLESGTVQCWGQNNEGQLGDGTWTHRSTPVSVKGLSGVSTLAPGAHHTCALLETGTVQCWGRNSERQLGDGTGTNRNTPVAVKSLSGVSELASGGYQLCGRLESGAVQCWGKNNEGQLGDGTWTGRSSPTLIAGLSGVSELTLGEYHSCALLESGTVQCWGRNVEGELGDGSKTNRNTPTPVKDLSGVSELAPGGAHTCALLESGTVQCWGSNSDGQLGDGTRTSHATSAAVKGLAKVAQPPQDTAAALQTLKQNIVEQAQQVLAQGDDYIPIEGSWLQPFHNPWALSAQPSVGDASHRVLNTQLKVKYAKNFIWNPKAQQSVMLRLRSYNGGLVGATWRVKPGDTLRVLIDNSLPLKTHGAGNGASHSQNGPHNLNTTNLHVHGLHVSPSYHSDNVLINIDPGEMFQTIVHIPKDHPPGTFWYHPHVHGSTAMQVSSGMAGALIIEGGLDDDPALQHIEDRIFV